MIALTTINTTGGHRRRDRELRTHCKLCRHGIYHGEPAVWLSNPMGLSHQDCADRHAASTEIDHS